MAEIFPGNLSRNPPAPHDHDAAAKPNELGEFGRNEQHSRTRFRASLDEPIEFLLGSDVDPPGGLVEDQKTGFGEKPFCEHHLLLISAAQEADRVEVLPVRIESS